jgi:hypothetical protein
VILILAAAAQAEFPKTEIDNSLVRVMRLAATPHESISAV